MTRIYNTGDIGVLSARRAPATRRSGAVPRRDRCCLARLWDNAVSDENITAVMNILPRHAEIWLLPYLKDRLRNTLRARKPKRAWVAITDHRSEEHTSELQSPMY